MWASRRRRTAERPSLDSPRMRSPRPFFVSLSLLAACALGLAACGGGDEEGTIPPEAAAVLLQSLEDARGERDQQDCQGIADAAGNLSSQVDQLPDTVDPEVRAGLEEGAANLASLADDPEKCEPSGTTDEGGQQPEGDTTDDFTETTPPPTETETTTEEAEEPPTQPENEGGGNLGQGNEGGQPPSDSGPSGGGGTPGGGETPDEGGVEPPTGGTDEG
jgi:hypothetical protein